MTTFLAGVETRRLKAVMLNHLETPTDESSFCIETLLKAALHAVDGDQLAMYREWLTASERSRHDIELLRDTHAVLKVAWQLIADGVIFPHRAQNYSSKYDIVFFLTTRGLRLLEDGPDDPLHPGFSAKFRAIVKDDETVVRIEDAAECLSRGLLRPAVVMLGLAVETTISILHRGWNEHLNHIAAPSPRGMAKELLEAIETHVIQMQNRGNRERKAALKRAINVAHDLRDDRNSCSHPGEVSLTRGEVEDLSRGASRAIVRLWEHGINEFWADFHEGPYPH